MKHAISPLPDPQIVLIRYKDTTGGISGYTYPQSAFKVNLKNSLESYQHIEVLSCNISNIFSSNLAQLGIVINEIYCATQSTASGNALPWTFMIPMQPSGYQTTGDATMFSYQSTNSAQTKTNIRSRLVSGINLNIVLTDQNLQPLTVTATGQPLTDYEFNLVLRFT